MKQLNYNYREKKRASTLLALAASELEAAETLVQAELPREALTHLYFSTFYASQSILVRYLKSRASHRSVEAELHKRYGKSRILPRQYVKLHSELHGLRTEYSYRKSHIPDPRLIARKLRVLQYYVKYVYRIVPKVETLEIVDGIYRDNSDIINDISYDVYCPKTYAHHTRITVWQPPFYRDIFDHNKIARSTRRLLKDLRVRHANDYVVGLNSKMDQYAGVHLVMLDVDSLDVTVEAALAQLGGILLKSGRGFHFIGSTLVEGQKEWEKEMRRIGRDKVLKNHTDRDHIQISLQRGYSTLRVTGSKVKPRVPVFYKEV